MAMVDHQFKIIGEPKGRTSKGGRRVWLDRDGQQTPLDLRLDLMSHSPGGFEWGYGGSGPAQLALAILSQLVDDDLAKKLHQLFKADVICKIENNRAWSIDSGYVKQWVQSNIDL